MQIKEFLDTEKGYVLVKDTCKRSEDWIEVPECAEVCTLLEEFLIFWKGTNNKRPHYDDWLECNHTVYDYLKQYKRAKIVWQRPQQPESLPFIDDEVQSLNDKYAEIEQVRQRSIDATLAERQSTYGSFEDVAFVTENIISILKKCNYDSMPHTHRMAMYMIASKIARIVNGDFNHLDSWHDIGGYAKLIENLIKENNNG